MQKEHGAHDKEFIITIRFHSSPVHIVSVEVGGWVNMLRGRVCQQGDKPKRGKLKFKSSSVNLLGIESQQSRSDK